MILICPNCATRYEADAAKFQPAGRKVRCAKCTHTWHQPAPAAEGADAVAPVQQPAPAETEVAPAAPVEPVSSAPAFAPAPQLQPAPESAAAASSAALARWRMGALTGWAALIAVVALGALIAVEARTEIAALWPKTATAYRALGLDVNTVGLAFQDVSYRVTNEDDQPTLHLKGRILNITKQDLAVPQIHAALTDDARRELYDWKIEPKVRNLKPGASTDFSASLPSPPSGARHVDLKFVKG